MSPVRKLLVIEDDEDVLAMTCELLRASGFHVTGTTRTREGRDHLRREVFEMVLTDLFTDSNDVTQSWRRVRDLQEAAGQTPVGLLTGSTSATHDAPGRGLAFALRKPFTTEDLLDAIARCLPSSDVPAAQQTTVREYFASLERRDWQHLGELCTVDVVYHLPAGPPTLSGPIRGRATFLAFAADVFAKFDEPRFAITSMRALPDGVLVRYEGSWRTDGVHRATLPGGILFRLAGGLIAEIGIRLDVRTLIESPRGQVTP